MTNEIRNLNDESIAPQRRIRVFCLVILSSFVTRHSSFLLGSSLLLLCGCATPPQPAAPVPTRHFDFQRDTFAYANELRWEYRNDADGKWTTRWRDPKPAYSQHCF